MSPSRAFLICMNSITALMGVILLACSIYVVVNFTEGWSSLVSLNALYAGIAAGALMIAVSLLGCGAAQKNQNKCLVFFYALLVTIALALQVAAAVVVLQYSGNLTVDSSYISANVTEAVAISVNNGILSAFTACCSGCPEASPAVCNNAAPFFANQTLPNCMSNATIVCDQVEPCNVLGEEACFVYAPTETNVLVPPINVDVSMCTMLTKVSVNGTALVGNVDTGACGGGSADAFFQSFSDFFASTFKWIGIVFAIVAGIQLLIILASLYILCCVNNEDDYRR